MKLKPGVKSPKAEVLMANDLRNARVARAKVQVLKESTVFVIPKTIGACGDLLYTLREERLALSSKVADMEKKEATLRDHIINSLPKEDATGVRGKVAQVSIKKVDKPTVKDWTKVWAYVKKNNAFDLLQRRLNETAVASRWDDKKEIPGVEKFEVVTVSCTKLGS